jgi:hypothetical protein
MGRRISARIGARSWGAIPVSLFWRRRRSLLQNANNAARPETLVQSVKTDTARQLPAAAPPPPVFVLREVRPSPSVSTPTSMPPGAWLPAPFHPTRSFRPEGRNQMVREWLLPKSPIVARPSPLAYRRTNQSRTLRERLDATRDIVIVHERGIIPTAVSPSPIHGEIPLRLTRSGRRSAATGFIPEIPARQSIPVVSAAVSEASPRRRQRPSERQLRTFSPHLRIGQVESTGSVSIDARPQLVSLVWRKHPGQADRPLPAANGYEAPNPAAATASADARNQQTTRGIPTTPVSPKQPKLDTAAAIDPVFASRLADDVMRRIDQRLRIERERRGL